MLSHFNFYTSEQVEPNKADKYDVQTGACILI